MVYIFLNNGCLLTISR